MATGSTWAGRAANGATTGGQLVGNPKGAMPALPRIPAVRSATAKAEHGALTDREQQLVLEHISVVRYVARQIRERLPQHVELDELVSAGTLGLVDAARKFNAGKNVQFRSYAQFRIRGAILDSLRSLDWSPRELRRKARGIEEAGHRLQARLNRPAQDSELADELGLSLLHLQQLQGKIRGLDVAALNEERGEEGGEEELAFLPAKESENPLVQCLEGEARGRLIAAIEALDERERLVMSLYYFEEMTMREIGEVLGVVESRVSQMHGHALGKLRGLLVDLRSAGKAAPARRIS